MDRACVKANGTAYFPLVAVSAVSAVTRMGNQVLFDCLYHFILYDPSYFQLSDQLLQRKNCSDELLQDLVPSQEWDAWRLVSLQPGLLC